MLTVPAKRGEISEDPGLCAEAVQLKAQDGMTPCLRRREKGDVRIPENEDPEHPRPRDFGLAGLVIR